MREYGEHGGAWGSMGEHGGAWGSMREVYPTRLLAGQFVTICDNLWK